MKPFYQLQSLREKINLQTTKARIFMSSWMHENYGALITWILINFYTLSALWLFSLFAFFDFAKFSELFGLSVAKISFVGAALMWVAFLFSIYSFLKFTLKKLILSESKITQLTQWAERQHIAVHVDIPNKPHMKKLNKI